MQALRWGYPILGLIEYRVILWNYKEQLAGSLALKIYKRVLVCVKFLEKLAALNLEIYRISYVH